jgi:Ca2+/Na+ antiporter
MLSLFSILVGVVFLLSFILWLWYMLTRPTQWARFTEKDHDFWVKRGLPVKWVGACKDFEQGRGLKVLVAFCILAALVLTITPFILPFIFPRHG